MFGEAGALISGMLRIMHPEQYQMALQMFKTIGGEGEFAVMDLWPSVFSAVTVVANRRCPLHRDESGYFPWFDILASVGMYTKAPLELQPLGVQVYNGPGTVVAFSGSGIRHGVAAADGSRICYAFYMRESVQDFVGVRPAGWMSQERYRPWIGHAAPGMLASLTSDPFAI